MTENINDILSTKRDWRKEERRKGDRRLKDGTPEQRKFLADCKRISRKPIPHNFELPPKDVASMVLGIIIGAIIFSIFIFSLTAHADEIIDMNKISMIESGNNPSAISADGGYGLFQITKPVLNDFRNMEKVAWEMPDMLNPTNNKEVAEWYLNTRIPQMLNHYHKSITVRNVIISYNAGISYVVRHKKLPKTTINYLRKYYNGRT